MKKNSFQKALINCIYRDRIQQREPTTKKLGRMFYKCDLSAMSVSREVRQTRARESENVMERRDACRVLQNAAAATAAQLLPSLLAHIIMYTFNFSIIIATAAAAEAAFLLL